ncbi:hypothetical protein ACE14D_19955, partial [Streptomyces sp. Act-28]
SDLHLYEVFGPFMTPGDVLGHGASSVRCRHGRTAPDGTASAGQTTGPNGIGIRSARSTVGET